MFGLNKNKKEIWRGTDNEAAEDASTLKINQEDMDMINNRFSNTTIGCPEDDKNLTYPLLIDSRAELYEFLVVFRAMMVSMSNAEFNELLHLGFFNHMINKYFDELEPLETKEDSTETEV